MGLPITIPQIYLILVGLFGVFLILCSIFIGKWKWAKSK